MAAIEFSATHSLSEAEALKRIKNLIKETKKEHGDLIKDLKEKWEGNQGTFSFSAKGYEVSGTILVSATEITLAGEIPWALSFLKGTIKKTLADRANELLK